MRPFYIVQLAGKARVIPRRGFWGHIFRPIHPEVVVKPGLRPLCTHETLQAGDWVYWTREGGKHVLIEGGRFLFKQEVEWALISENPEKHWYPFALRPVGNKQT